MPTNSYNLPNGWSLTTIGTSCDILDNLRRPISEEKRQNRQGHVPYYGANGQQGWIDSPIFNEDLILLAEDGGNFDNYANQPIAYMIHGEAWVNNHAHVLRAKYLTTNLWVFYNLVHKDIRFYIRGGTRAKLNRGELQTIEIPLPPLFEQKIIANILDTLDTQIQQTEQLIAKLKQMKIGLLHDLLTKGIDGHGDVRDPVAHPEEFKEESFLQKRIKLPKKWEIQLLKSFLVGIDAGKSPDCPDQPAGAGDWGILKVSAIHPTGFRAEENKVITNPAYIKPAYEVHDGDLLMSRANTSELVGIVCLVSKPRPQLLLCDKTLRLQVNPKNALSEFIFYMLQMPFVRTQIEMHATGSSASMKNISQSSIKNLVILAPSREEQKEIIAILNAHDARITAEENELAKLKQLKKGLMHDLLTGHVRVTQLMAESGQLAVRSKSVSDCNCK
ncbi:hypothetical protein KSF_063410 [Reticulibacter mediterranei]|uniref:Type I restriction modification DNA specificity domain-containing protein n=1 Tax=Reticulibacter mediterranei TaxID=2778369 RepID=A0A8J3N5A4_9CHLR|nr:restriction endonuclease subunit S [Reticulibacter mediterranei]GHO96293.1 hypothetical protein KSF_063410 [Reticulibacter mediterranei]